MVEDKDKKEESQKDTAENKKGSESSNDTKGCGWGCLCAVIIIVIGIFAFNSCKRQNEKNAEEVRQSEIREKKQAAKRKTKIIDTNKDLARTLKNFKELGEGWTDYIDSIKLNPDTDDDDEPYAIVNVNEKFSDLSNSDRFKVAHVVNNVTTNVASDHHFKTGSGGATMLFFYEDGTRIGRSKVLDSDNYKWFDN